ncbi:aminopeptidase [Natronococcus occultus]|uniref:Leucyl aminopeptidase (Aminopeptidase T) n=1 Tax=Natronococcus occultus SP4 TaxID=694430 RepID=L0JV30_9EURY|nr:aminopeptidase [Natronococcus occultus]AGB36150.1 leucyl aminopeptidase (aminopeptidase T) [Natronococcus occultus SP4]
MDERIREHAAVLVDWSARVEDGDDVVLSAGPDAHELAVAVAEELGERGANLLATYSSGEITRAYLTARDDEDGFEEPAHERALLEAADVYLSLGGGRNTSATADVPGETRQKYRSARKAVREARYDTRWVSTVHPTRSLAQQANMSYEAYREFAYDAILRDWESLAEEMGRLKTLLDEGSAVRLVSQNTDLTMRIDGRTAVNSAASVAYDSHNLPSGEVFTAPYGTEGVVAFDVPMTIRGEPVEDVRLEFEDGEVVDHTAERGEAVIGDVLETDAGARRLGELGVGMNRGIDRYTDNILFDEKMGETVHLAVGRAYDACLPEDESGNDSAVHVDLITDVSEDSRLEIDGEVVQRNGRFRWEDGFESEDGRSR